MMEKRFSAVAGSKLEVVFAGNLSADIPDYLCNG